MVVQAVILALLCCARQLSALQLHKDARPAADIWGRRPYSGAAEDWCPRYHGVGGGRNGDEPNIYDPSGPIKVNCRDCCDSQHCLWATSAKFSTSQQQTLRQLPPFTLDRMTR